MDIFTAVLYPEYIENILSYAGKCIKKANPTDPKLFNLISVPYDFSELDKAVHDAIVSIYIDRTEKGLVPIATLNVICEAVKKVNPDVAEKHSIDKFGFNSDYLSKVVTKSIAKMRSNEASYVHWGDDETCDIVDTASIITSEIIGIGGEKYYHFFRPFILGVKEQFKELAETLAKSLEDAKQ